ncbi:SAV_2336 N-terminal domain-related protein, partial [Actinoplanes auranticolor]
MIERLVTSLAEALPAWSAWEIADLLWLAAVAADRPDDPSPDMPDSKLSESTGPLPSAESAGQPRFAQESQGPLPLPLSLAGDQPEQSSALTIPATAVGLRTLVTLERTTAAGRALALFRRVHRPSGHTVDIDATIEATADAGRLVVVTSPASDRGVDIAVVVESGPVAAAWEDAIRAFEKSLWRTGAFRSISQWSMTATTDGDGEYGLTVADASGFAHHPDRLIDATGRRLILVLSDTASDHWYGVSTWNAVRSWANTTPTAVIQLLPENHWGYTAMGLPDMLMRSRRPAGHNADAQVRPAWWSADVSDDTTRVPVPVLTLSATSMTRWADSVVTGAEWSEAVSAEPPRRSAPSVTNAALTPTERIRAFQARASPQAQALARILAGAPALSLPLIRVLQHRLVPGSDPSHLAEVLVSGLFERTEPGGDRLRLRLRPGLRDLLRRGMTTTQEWDTYEVLTDHLLRHAGSGETVQALLADPMGSGRLDIGLEPFAAMGRELALRLGLTFPKREQLTSRPRRAASSIVFVSDYADLAPSEDEWRRTVAAGMVQAGASIEDASFVLDTARYLRLPDAVSNASKTDLINSYASDGLVGRAARAAVEALIDPGTEVIVAHGAGAVVSYDALCHHPEWDVHSMISLAWPLTGDQTDIVASSSSVRGVAYRWPVVLDTWIDLNDSVQAAVADNLVSATFGGRVRVERISGIDGSAQAFLLNPATGRAILDAITAGRSPTPSMSAAARFLRELRRLYAAAGSPNLDALIRSAHTIAPSGQFSEGALRDWLHGSAVPTPEDALQTFVDALERSTSSESRRSPEWWERLRRDAQAESKRVPESAEPPFVRTYSPFELGVHRAMDESGELPDLTAYFPREHDLVLAGFVTEALAGKSRIVSLVGGSASGKTRTCWEAVGRLPANWRLSAPRMSEGTEAVLAEIARIGPRTVLWLDEIQRYLVTPHVEGDQRVATAIADLLVDEARSPVLILATGWPHVWHALTGRPADPHNDAHAKARALLSGTDLLVPDRFTPDELVTLRQEGSVDPRLHIAAQRAEAGKVTQYLAAAPALLQRYAFALPVEKAVVDAAVDLRRFGHPDRIRADTLHQASAGYVPEPHRSEADDAWWQRALGYAEQTVLGMPGLLARVSDVGYPFAFRLAPVVEELATTERRAIQPPGSLWSAIATTINDPEVLRRIASKAATGGHDMGARSLIALADRLERVDVAAQHTSPRRGGSTTDLPGS